MNILLIGSGGREHALAQKLKASSQCQQLFIAPGNAGTAECGTNMVVDLADHAAIIAVTCYAVWPRILSVYQDVIGAIGSTGVDGLKLVLSSCKHIKHTGGQR